MEVVEEHCECSEVPLETEVIDFYHFLPSFLVETAVYLGSPKFFKYTKQVPHEIYPKNPPTFPMELMLFPS